MFSNSKLVPYTQVHGSLDDLSISNALILFNEMLFESFRFSYELFMVACASTRLFVYSNQYDRLVQYSFNIHTENTSFVRTRLRRRELFNSPQSAHVITHFVRALDPGLVQRASDGRAQPSAEYVQRRPYRMPRGERNKKAHSVRDRSTYGSIRLIS